MSNPAILFNEKTYCYNFTLISKRKEVRSVFRYGDKVSRNEVDVKITRFFISLNNKSTCTRDNRADLIFSVSVNLFEFSKQFLDVRCSFRESYNVPCTITTSCSKLFNFSIIGFYYFRFLFVI
ncbi:hypothetical protein D3C76_1288000 [compost metagenome]